jgi:ATP-dependent RNA helicase SUPV3L1/SUV3
MERLSVPQIKQIAGRAGRYRSAHQAMNEGQRKTETSASVGLVTTLNAADLHVVQEAMTEEAPPVIKEGILPPGEYLEEVSARLPKGIPFEYILKRVCSVAEMHPRFSVCNISDQSALSRVIEDVEGLTIPQRLTLTAAPASSNADQLLVVLKALAIALGKRQEVTIVDVPEIELEVLEAPVSGDRTYLEKLENLHKSLIIFLWLSYRFGNIFKDRDMATYAKEMTEEKINICLLEFSANPLLRKRALAPKRQFYKGTTTEGPEGTDNLNLSELDDSASPVDWSKVPVPDAEVRHVASAA